MPAECCIHGSAAVLWNLPTRTGRMRHRSATLANARRWSLAYHLRLLQPPLASGEHMCRDEHNTALRRWLHPRLCAARKAAHPASAQPFMPVVAAASMLHLCCTGIFLSDGPGAVSMAGQSTESRFFQSARATACASCSRLQSMALR